LGLNLIAVAWSDFSWLLNILQVVIGLGLIIFVHELGHFLVAKACGVRCDKFYLGFDFGGLRLWSHRWGETEYGIGIFPLGGYVKMLGQEDNPAKLREELERAKAASQQGGAAAAGDSNAAKSGKANENAGETPLDAAALAEAEQSLYDPRSYLAKSVPQRMAIISAGVIMNVVFAIFTGAVAYWGGVFNLNCGVGSVTPGSAAWKTNFQVDDKILSVNDKPMRRFTDMQQTIFLDAVRTIPVEIQRPGVEKPFVVELTPSNTPIPTIGVTNPLMAQLDKTHPTLPGGPAWRAEPKLAPGDVVVAVNDQPVARYGEIRRQLGLNPDKPLRLTVERPAPKAGREAGTNAGAAAMERLTVEIAPQPMLELGLIMPMGEITAIRNDSIAAKLGIQPGDRIVKLDGEPVGDAVRFPEKIRRLAASHAKIKLTVLRKEANLDFEIPLEPFGGYEYPEVTGEMMSLPEIGIAFASPKGKIEAVVPGGPADRAKVTAAQTIATAKLILPEKETLKATDWGQEWLKMDVETMPIDFSKPRVAWPLVVYLLQSMPPGTTVELTFTDKQTATLQPIEAKDWFLASRGLHFEPAGTIVKAKSFSNALRLGVEETGDSMTAVFKFLRRIHDIPRKIGGPVTIFKQAYHYAAKGFSDFCIFLTLIGANLAVLNALPIPVLDGGHMVFLLYEGITRKPPNERIQLLLSYIGLLLLLALMIFATGLDVGLISRD
jgi:regulator of sigma E protease